MKLNFKPIKVAFLDFETQSECDLPKQGSRRYSKHPTTKVLTCCVKVDGQMLRMGPQLGESDIEKLRNIASTHTFIAHNAPFDAAIMENVLGIEAEWDDTLPRARAAGLPGGLNLLSKAIGGRGKHKDGERLIQMLCIIRNGKIPAIGPAHKLLMEYNVQDVEELETIYSRVKDFGEPVVMTVDRIINDRGIPVDIKLLSAIQEMYDQNEKKFGDEFAEFTSDPDRLEGLNPRSPKQLHEWLAQRGVNITGKDGKQSLGKPIVQQFLADPEQFLVDQECVGELEAVKEMLELRRELAGVGRGKIDKALSLADGGRIYDQFVYYGAHTGRWTSRGLQLHNMPSALKVSIDMRHVEPNYAAVTALAEEASRKTKTHVTVSDCLNIMLRRMVDAENLLVVDYGAVEARCLAWLAESQPMLAAYNDPKESLYLRMGDVVFQRRIDKKVEQLEYVLCKALVLGCGYGMSGAKFKAQCAIRESREFMKMLENANIDLGECVKTYRKTYPEVPKLWKAMGEAAMDAFKTGNAYAGKCEFKIMGEDMHMVLPSKRPIVYRNARIEMVVPSYCKLYGMPEIPVPTVTFDNPRGFRGFLYGAKIVENACQGICRDLLAEAKVALEMHEGLPIVLDVHDEIACEGPESKLARMCEIMTQPASWADGFPVMVEGYSGKQWTKTYDGYKEIKMLRGKVV